MTDPDSAEAYAEANRAMWNATADVHARASLPDLLAEVAKPDFTTFDFVEERVFARIGLGGKDVAQLSCNNGRELISCKKVGAGRCAGFDIADKFIAQGQALARAGGVEVEFFGERTTFPAGPATLSLRTGAAILPNAAFQNGRRVRGEIRPPLVYERTGKLRNDVQAVTQLLAREFESLIREAPEQWHVLQPLWPSDRP